MKSLKTILRKLVNSLPPNVNCEDMHHSAKDRHETEENCPPLGRYHEAIADAIKALIAGR